MEEVISILQNYSEMIAGAVVFLMAWIAIIFLAGILRQIKRLNASLSSITGNMQAYFDVILSEDMQEEEQEITEKVIDVRNAEKGEEATAELEKTAEETELEYSRKRAEEEKLFNAVLQEYFS